MADVSDVADSLVALIAGILYPNGIGQTSSAGVDVRVYQGWPEASQLDADLAAGTCHVSVFPRDEERNTTRWPTKWKEASRNTVTLALTTSGQTITIAGVLPAAGNSQHVTAFVNGAPYAYLVQAGDTLASIAAALAGLIASDLPGTSATGAVVNLPATARIGALRVGVTGTVVRTTRTQERVFQLTVWANTPTNRAAVAAPVDGVLSDTPRLALSDGTTGRLRYRGSPVSDHSVKTTLFRRDLLYTVEFSTTIAATASEITIVQVNTDVAVAGVEPYQHVATSYF